jgi:hypothetical protein
VRVNLVIIGLLLGFLFLLAVVVGVAAATR